jgi:hypothetical protein
MRTSQWARSSALRLVEPRKWRPSGRGRESQDEQDSGHFLAVIDQHTAGYPSRSTRYTQMTLAPIEPPT